MLELHHAIFISRPVNLVALQFLKSEHNCIMFNFVHSQSTAAVFPRQQSISRIDIILSPLLNTNAVWMISNFSLQTIHHLICSSAQHCRLCMAGWKGKIKYICYLRKGYRTLTIRCAKIEWHAGHRSKPSPKAPHQIAITVMGLVRRGSSNIRHVGLSLRQDRQAGSRLAWF